MKSKNKTQNFFQVYGYNNCFPLLHNPVYDIVDIYISKDKETFLSKKINYGKFHKQIRFLNKKEFANKFAKIRSQGIVVNFTGPVAEKIINFKSLSENSCLLILDNVEDPQNAGQIIRTAECAGISGIIFPSHNSFKVTNTIINISQGAFINIPLYEVTNISTTILELKKNNFWIIGIENNMNAKLWSKLDYTGNIAIVVGSEGKGLRKKVISHCDFLGQIPMQGNTNSLNVSAAVSAILFERLRQIKFN
jgi:23S rRNA (guanosine2251-2'-O)-methyltransferase